MLLSIGGYSTSAADDQNEADRNRPMSDRIAMLDIASGRYATLL